MVCTSTLDLGIDWGDVDLVIQVGAPKGASRMVQRIGRANHRLDEPSRRCWCRPTASRCWSARPALEAIAEARRTTPPLAPGALDVLAQQSWACACSEPFDAGELYDEVRSAGPYRDLPRETSSASSISSPPAATRCEAYERFRRIVQAPDGRWRIAHPRIAQQYRLNVGTIVAAPMLKCGSASAQRQRSAGRPHDRRGRGGLPRDALPGDTFVFAGQVCASRACARTRCSSRRADARGPEDPVLGRRQVPALHLSRQARARDARRPTATGSGCRRRCANGWSCSASGRVLAGARRDAGRDLPARQPALSWSPIRSRGGSRTRRSACC